MKEDPNPLATAHPTARKVCRFFRGGMRACWRGLKVALLGLLACLFALPLLISPWMRSWLGPALAVVATASFWLVCASAGLYIVCYVLRLVVIALFFMRYSLGQLMGSILFGGSCVTMLIKFPDELKGFPAIGLFLLALLIWIYIIAHDPEDPWFTPEFVRRTFGPKPVEQEAEEQAEPVNSGQNEGAVEDPEGLQ